MCKSKYTTSQYSNHTQIHIPAQLQIGLLLSIVAVIARKHLWKCESNSCSSQSQFILVAQEISWSHLALSTTCLSGGLVKDAALYLQNTKHSWELDWTGGDFFPLLHSRVDKEILQTKAEQTIQLNAFHWDYFFPSISLEVLIFITWRITPLKGITTAMKN